MIPLLLTSLGMWALILDKFRTFARFQGGDIGIAEAEAAILGQELPTGDKGLRRSLIDEFISSRAGATGVDRALWRYLADKHRRSLGGKLPAIGVLAAVAPLLGLLGTVLGMIQTFEVIAVFGTSNAKAMAGGISVALVTTQAGLMVAIPGLFLSGALQRKARSLACNLDEFSLAVDQALRNGTPQQTPEASGS